MIKTTESGESDLNWPPAVICAVLLGFIIAIYLGQSPGMAVDPLHRLNRLFTWRGPSAAAEFGQALIVTANPGDQLTVVTTLSPRGFHPLLATSDLEVRSQIRAYPGAVKLAVVDANLPDYARIARTLRDILPSTNIIVLQSSRGSQEIGPMLLRRLGFLREFS